MQLTRFQQWFQGVRIFSHFPNERPLDQNPPTHPQPNIVRLGKTVHKNGRPLSRARNYKKNLLIRNITRLKIYLSILIPRYFRLSYGQV